VRLPRSATPRPVRHSPHYPSVTARNPGGDAQDPARNRSHPRPPRLARHTTPAPSDSFARRTLHGRSPTKCLIRIHPQTPLECVGPGIRTFHLVVDGVPTHDHQPAEATIHGYTPPRCTSSTSTSSVHVEALPISIFTGPPHVPRKIGARQGAPVSWGIMISPVTRLRWNADSFVELAAKPTISGLVVTGESWRPNYCQKSSSRSLPFSHRVLNCYPPAPPHPRTGRSGANVFAIQLWLYGLNAIGKAARSLSK